MFNKLKLCLDNTSMGDGFIAADWPGVRETGGDIEAGTCLPYRVTRALNFNII